MNLKKILYLIFNISKYTLGVIFALIGFSILGISFLFLMIAEKLSPTLFDIIFNIIDEHF